MQTLEERRKYLREHMRKYRAEHPELKEYQRRWFQEHKERAAELRRKRFALHRPDWRGYRLKAKYGLTVEQWESLFVEQNGLCAICGDWLQMGRTSGDRRISVDHDHQTRKVRGLLCERCNLGLGSFKDNELLLARARQYLNRGGIENGWNL